MMSIGVPLSEIHATSSASVGAQQSWHMANQGDSVGVDTELDNVIF